jgi:hypothetical protein
MTLRSVAFLSFVAMLMLARPAHAAQGTAACTGFITSLPATISTSGTWCLKQNLGTAPPGQPAITISTDDVTIDCDNFWVSGENVYSAVYAKDRFNVTVRNCFLYEFYTAAIDLETTSNVSGGRYLVENNIISGSRTTGIRVDGDGSIVRHNQIDGGPTEVTPLTLAYGIYTNWSVDIIGNAIAGVVFKNGTNGSAYGIYNSNNASGSIDDNSITNLEPKLYGHMYGIYNVNSGRISMRDNTLTGNGTAGGIGLTCTNANARAFRNAIGGFAQGMKFCGDAGNNDVTP